jgi:hypothetical protein
MPPGLKESKSLASPAALVDRCHYLVTSSRAAVRLDQIMTF